MTRKWIHALAALFISATFMLAGCNNFTDATIDDNNDDGDTTLYTQGRTVVASVSGIDEPSLAAQLVNKSRTVLPTPYDLASTGLTYILSGTSTNGSTIGPKPVTVTKGDSDSKTGTLTIDFPDSSTWVLTLTAYKNSETSSSATAVQELAYKDGDATKYASSPVLTATTNADLRNGAPTGLKFTMNVKGLETPGSVSFYKDTSAFASLVVEKEAPTVQKIEIGLYNMVTGEVITLKNATSSNALATLKKESGTASHEGSASASMIETTLPIAAGSATGAASPLYAANTYVFEDTVPPGEYNLGVNIYNSTDQIIGQYYDLIVIAPGQVTYFTDKMDVINEVPTAPQNLSAQLVYDSEDDTTYEAKLKWKDTSKNETNFEVELYDVTKLEATTAFTTTSTSASGTSTTVSTNAVLLGTLCYSSSKVGDETSPLLDWDESCEFYADGSLFANNTEITLKLETGKLYEVRIRAINALGSSDWVERAIDAVPTATTGLESDSNGNANTAYKVKDDTYYYHINRVRIEYNYSDYNYTLNVGKDSNGGKVGTEYLNQYITYGIWEGADLPFIFTSEDAYTSTTASDVTTITDGKLVTIDNTTPSTVTSDITSKLVDGKYAFSYKTTNGDKTYLTPASFKYWVKLDEEDPETATNEVKKTDYNDIVVRAYFTTSADATVTTYTYNEIADDLIITAFSANDTDGTELEADTNDKLYHTTYESYITVDTAKTTFDSTETYYTYNSTSKAYEAVASSETAFASGTTYYTKGDVTATKISVALPEYTKVDQTKIKAPVSGNTYYTHDNTNKKYEAVTDTDFAAWAASTEYYQKTTQVYDQFRVYVVKQKVLDSKTSIEASFKTSNYAAGKYVVIYEAHNKTDKLWYSKTETLYIEH